MNYETTLKKMLEAAAAAAKGKWKSFSRHGEQELRKLAEAAAWIEADLIADMAAAAMQPAAAKRKKMERTAKLRAELGLENVQLAAETAVNIAVADAQLAVQDAINAALGVLRGAINQSIGIAIL